MEENLDVSKFVLKAIENNFYDLSSPNAGKVEAHNLMCNLTRSDEEFDEYFGPESTETLEDGGAEPTM